MTDTPKKLRTRKPKATEAAEKPVLAAVPATNVVANDFTAKLRERSVGGLSDLLGIDRSTINKWIKKHRCPTVREAAGRGARKRVARRYRGRMGLARAMAAGATPRRGE